jgi:hypothetical protein
VTRFVTLVALNLRELWMSFRLLLMVALLLGSALVLVAVSSLAVADPPTAYAASLAAAAIAVAGLAAYGVAIDRRKGVVAWLAVRAVPRSSVLLAWVTALVAPLLAGLAISALLAWLTLGVRPEFAASAAGFWLAIVAVGAGTFAAMVVGVLLGTLLPPWSAAACTVVVLLAVAAITLLLPSTPLPTNGFLLLADTSVVERPIAFALQSIGTSLIVTAAMTGAAIVLLRHADL